MRFLITTKEEEPFFTHWYDPENHHNELLGMVVYDLNKSIYTNDGREWFDIEEDNL